MGLPSKKRPRSEKRTRASHFALRRPTLTSCRHCGKPVRPHYACSSCGMYNGRQVLAVRSKAEKRLKKRERERAQAAKEEKAE